uniref:hypothetical protein n=1 Tax=Pararhizobium sp. IMCC3301 TaxID=3067904 RepID=UPI002740A615|nr:hypothetical protein [Pararhizobium sp. IMCC3301]
MLDSTTSQTIEAPNGAPSSPARIALVPAALAALGAIILVGSEIWIVAVSTIWALHGLLGANLTVDIILGILLLPGAVWATWKTVVLSIEAERKPENWF